MKHPRRWLFAFVALAFLLSAPGLFAAEKSRLLMNTAWPVYYSPACPTINAIKTAERFGLPDNRNAAAPVDPDGYPKADFGVMVHADVPGIQGTYKLSWIGTGTPAAAYGSTVKVANIQRANGRTTADLIHTGNLLAFKITGTGNGARDLKLLRPGYTSDAKVFTDAYLASKEPFGGVRLMDWLQTNTTTVRAWQDRCKVTDAQWSDPKKGGPIEPWLDWAAATGKDVWVNVPHLTDDGYVQELAKLCAEKLANAPNANVWLEHGNEMWNWSFPQAKWMSDVATAAGLPRMSYHAKRTVEIGRAFRQFFPANRTRLVYAVQFAGFAEGEAGLKWALQKYPDHGIYGAAVAPYMGEDNNPTTATTAAQADFLLATAKRWTTGDSNSVKGLTNVRVKLDALGLKLIDYEGGITNALGGTASLISARKAAQAMTQAGEATGIYLDVVFARGVDTHVYFNDFSQYGRTGYWGLSNSPSTSTPKFKAAAAAAAKYTAGTVPPPVVDPPPAAAPVLSPPVEEAARLKWVWSRVPGVTYTLTGPGVTVPSTNEDAYSPKTAGDYFVTTSAGGKSNVVRYGADPKQALREELVRVRTQINAAAAEQAVFMERTNAVIADLISREAQLVAEIGGTQ